MNKDAKLLLCAMSTIVLTFVISLAGGLELISRNSQALLEAALLLCAGAYILYLSVSKRNMDETDMQFNAQQRFARVLPATLVLAFAGVNTLYFLNVISKSIQTLFTGILVLGIAGSWWYLHKSST